MSINFQVIKEVDMVGGYWDNFVRINLTTNEISKQSFSDEDLRNYIGGSGLGAKVVCEETDENTDPLGPENVLTIFTGPFVGTGLPNFGRYDVATKSPLNGLFGEANSGGTWGTKLKHAGVDGLILTGQPQNRYIYISTTGISAYMTPMNSGARILLK